MNHNDQAIEDARKFLEDILSFFGLNAVVSATSEAVSYTHLTLPTSDLV